MDSPVAVRSYNSRGSQPSFTKDEQHVAGSKMFRRLLGILLLRTKRSVDFLSLYLLFWASLLLFVMFVLQVRLLRGRLFSMFRSYVCILLGLISLYDQEAAALAGVVSPLY
jgi:hypothetical protein